MSTGWRRRRLRPQIHVIHPNRRRAARTVEPQKDFGYLIKVKGAVRIIREIRKFEIKLCEGFAHHDPPMSPRHGAGYDPGRL